MWSQDGPGGGGDMHEYQTLETMSGILHVVVDMFKEVAFENSKKTCPSEMKALGELLK